MPDGFPKLPPLPKKPVRSATGFPALPALPPKKKKLVEEPLEVPADVLRHSQFLAPDSFARTDVTRDTPSPGIGDGSKPRTFADFDHMTLDEKEEERLKGPAGELMRSPFFLGGLTGSVGGMRQGSRDIASALRRARAAAPGVAGDAERLKSLLVGGAGAAKFGFGAASATVPELAAFNVAAGAAEDEIAHEKYLLALALRPGFNRHLLTQAGELIKAYLGARHDPHQVPVKDLFQRVAQPGGMPRSHVLHDQVKSGGLPFLLEIHISRVHLDFFNPIGLRIHYAKGYSVVCKRLELRIKRSR